ncbi:MAG: CpXC domain-containing protein [Victivallales bacterium]|nr:CpXC domain-containing protein [Victivallales bacterium]
MSENKKEMVTCPHCGHRISTQVTTVIRHDDVKALDALYKGTLNRVRCPKCGHDFLVDTTLIYRDDENPFIVYYVDIPEDADLHTYEREIDVMATEAAMKENLDRPTVRLTVSLPDFIEKISLRRLGLDDRLIEYAKHQLFSNLGEERLSSSAHRLLVDFSNKDANKLAFIVYDRETNRPISSLHVPMEEFNNLVKEFSVNDQLMNELDTLFPSCYVSVDRLFG